MCLICHNMKFDNGNGWRRSCEFNANMKMFPKPLVGAMFFEVAQ